MYDSGNLEIAEKATPTGKKPYECNRGDKKFSDKSAINHLKAHKKCITERTFTCNTCGKSFQNRACFKAHVRTSHQQQQTKNHERSATTSNDTLAAKRARKSADPGTRPAASQASAATAGSSWEADPVHIVTNLVSSSDEDIAQTQGQHWSQIPTRFSRQNRLQDWYNFRLSTINPTNLREQLSRIFADQPTVFQVNLSFGFIP